MNSIKTAFVSLILLGVLYGMYQVLQAPPVHLDEEGYAITPPSSVEILPGEEIDPVDLFADDESVIVEAPDEAPQLIASAGDEEQISPPALTELDPSTELEPADSTSKAAFVGTQSTEDSSGGGFVPPEQTADLIAPTPLASQEGSSGAFQPAGFAESTPQAPLARGAAQVASPLPKRSQVELTDFEFESRLNQAWTDAEMLVDNQKFAEALTQLSYFYGDSRLSIEDEESLLNWLDALAAKVIYSTEHQMLDAYIVQSTDTLSSIATAHGMTEDLLYNINQTRFGVDGKLYAGLELKVVHGPFHAELDRSSKTLTLFSSDAYAGRFDLSIASTAPLPLGSYTVLTRTNGLTSGDSSTSGYSITLANGVELVEMAAGGTPPTDGIGLAMNDMFDVYSILSQESIITIVD